MDAQWTEQRARTGPVRPPRPSQSFDYSGSSPRTTPRTSADFPAMIRKRISNHRIRGASQLQNQLSPSRSASYRYSGAGSTNGPGKRGSLRKAVRKLFGRKVKDDPPPRDIVRPSHSYHRSDPGQCLQTQKLLSERAVRQNPPVPLLPRAFSAPLFEPSHLRSPSLRGRSPAALHFPKSAQLKPLDLGNPFYHKPIYESKRRATLPTLSFVDDKSVPVGTALGSPSDSGMGGMCPDLPIHISRPEIGLAVTSVPLLEKRRSRSASDLIQIKLQRPSTRKRSEEIEFWRESFAETVLLNPSSPPLVDEEGCVDVEGGSIAPSNDLLKPTLATTTCAAAAASRSETDLDDKASSPSAGRSRPTTSMAERNEELERRVASLESSLLEFQSNLERLTISSRTRTLSPTLESRQRLRRHHTPSILIDTLQQPPWRSQSIEPPHKEPKYEGAGDVVEREWDGHEGTDGPGTPDWQSRSAHSGAVRQDPSPGLYEILADERAARYRLESQVQSLQREVTTMATRLERGSWNSYSAPALPMDHRPRTPEESERGASRDGVYDTRTNAYIVSRFSGSDSVVDGDIHGMHGGYEHPPQLMNVEEEGQTPYRTPLTEHAMYRFSQDDEMF